MRWQPMQQGRIQTVEAAATASINTIFGQIGGFGQYNLQGAQHATTTLTWPPNAPIVKNTTNQQHSEMVALAAALPRDGHGWWQMNAAGQVVAVPAAAIGGANFATNQPHCGHCTIMLHILNLPLGTPTQGRYNQAVNLAYTVPRDMTHDINVLCRLHNSNQVGNASLGIIRGLIGEFVSPNTGPWVMQVGAAFVTAGGVVAMQPPGTALFDWADVDTINANVPQSNDYNGATLLGFLWKLAFKGIYNNVQ
jgi:hypothetical protein